MARDAAALRRARRAARESARGQTRILPKSTTGRAIAAPREYALSVARGDVSSPAMGTMEAKNLARQASLARWGRAPAELSVLEKYFYHNKEQNFGLDADRYEEGDTRDASDNSEEEDDE